VTADATNLLWGPLANLRALIAGSASFQDLVGADDATEAAGRIYCPGFPATEAEPVQAARPLAWIDLADQPSFERVGNSAYAASGTIHWALEADVPAAHQGTTAAQLETAHTWFTALLGDIIDEMLALAEGGGYLAVRRATVISPPMRSGGEVAAGEGDFYQAVVEIEWEGGA